MVGFSVGKITGLKTNKTQNLFEFWLCYSLIVKPWKNYLLEFNNLLMFKFSLQQVGLIIPLLQVYWDNLSEVINVECLTHNKCSVLVNLDEALKFTETFMNQTGHSKIKPEYATAYSRFWL